MSSYLLPFVLLVSCCSTLASKSLDPKLPLCPTSVQYFPQSLPMHCRMARNANPESGANCQGATCNKPNQPNGVTSDNKQALPFPVPVGFPGAMPPMPPQFPAPSPYPMPGGFPPMPGPMSGPMPMAMAAPMPVPMSMPPAAPSHKLPVIVMPFYSPDHNYKGPSKDYEDGGKKRKKTSRKHRNMWSDNSGNDDDTDSDDDSHEYPAERRSFRRSSKRRHRKRKRKVPKELLTPVIQYVTKDGYVIYEKEITKNEARTWLDMRKGLEEPPPEETKATYTEIDELAAADEPPKNVIELNSKPLRKRKKVGIKTKHNRNIKPKFLIQQSDK